MSSARTSTRRPQTASALAQLASAQALTPLVVSTGAPRSSLQAEGNLARNALFVVGGLVALVLGARGKLLVFLNGSGGSPAGGSSGGLSSWYGVARDEGLHVLGVSYRSSEAVGTMCRGDDACFEPTRVSQLTGVLQAGAGLQDWLEFDGASLPEAQLA